VAARAAAVARGLAESAAAGVTTIGEIATALDGLVPLPRAAPRLRVYREALGLAPAAIAASSRGLVRDLGRLAAAGLYPGISPHAPYSCGRGLGRHAIDAAVAGRLPVAMHVAESREEAELLATGAGPFRDLLESLGAWPEGGPELLSAADWIGLLARPPCGVIVHGTFLPDDPAAFARLVCHRDRLAVAVCPRTTRSLSGTLPPVRAFLAAGVRVALGTDSRASNPDLDLRAECRTLVEAGLASPREAVVMATRDAACATGFERRTGRLAAGMAADIAVLAAAGTAGDPFAAAVAASTRVLATLCRGRLIAGDPTVFGAAAGGA
jgi:cytosine/adenosine deaminase-related metal-dependent hydrolase